MKKQLQENEEQNLIPPPKCGGVDKPDDKFGERGSWECENDKWVWIPAV